MRTYASSPVKRKSFYRKSELQMFLLISGGHIGGPKRSTNMASPYKALQSCVKCFGKLLRNCGPQRREIWTNCLYTSLLEHFIFLAFSTGRFPILFFRCVTVKTIYKRSVMFTIRFSAFQVTKT